MTYEHDSVPDDPRIHAFLAALIPTGGQIGAILEHMKAFEASGRSTADVPPQDVLAGILAGALFAELSQTSIDALESGAALLEDVGRAIERQILLVPPEADS